MDKSCIMKYAIREDKAIRDAWERQTPNFMCPCTPKCPALIRIEAIING